MSFLNELKKRNVIRVAVTYVIIAWLVIQVLSLAAGSFEAPPWVMKMTITAIAIGFFPVVLFSWAFELTPEGIKKEDEVVRDETLVNTASNRFNYITIFAALGVLGLFAYQQFNPPGASLSTPPVEQSAITPTPVDSSEADKTTTPSEDASIAVMPFADFSSDQDQDYFANGISEELLNVLARIDGLRVASRTSAFAFKGKDTPISEIGLALNVAHILEGSIRKAGDTLRITAQLIDTKTDVHMWSETYDRPLTTNNIFAIQDEIAAAIVSELKGRLQFDAGKSSTTPIASVEALQLYLRARENMNKRRAEPLQLAVDGFKEVIELDPGYAPAYSGLADTYLLMDDYADLDSEESISLATPLIEKALELEPNSAEALTSAARALIGQNSGVAKALALTNGAIEANPNYSPAYHVKAMLQSTSNPPQALETYKKALELDPLSSVLHSNIAGIQFQLDDIDGARKTSLNDIRWNPESHFGYSMLANISQNLGNYESAHRYYMDAQAINPAVDSIKTSLTSIYLEVGLVENAKEMATTPEAKFRLHINQGERQKALALLDNFSPMQQLDMSVSLENHERFLKLAEPITSIILAENHPIETYQQVGISLSYVSALQATQQDDDKGYRARLDKYYANKSPENLKRLSPLLLGAFYGTLSRDDKHVYKWLNRLIDLGFSHTFLDTHYAFDWLRKKAEFKAILKRNKSNAAHHRKLIEEQLADPKPNWVFKSS